jgi:hypothetical protein
MLPGRHAVMLLERLEMEERRLLAWGCVDGAFTGAEIQAHAEAVLLELPTDGTVTTDNVIEELLTDLKWLWPLPDGDRRFRTRSAEAIRLLATLRQIRRFPGMTADVTNGLWRSASALVADYRLLVQPRRFPRRNLSALAVERELSLDAGGEKIQRAVFRRLLRVGGTGERALSGFQVRATSRIFSMAGHTGRTGTVVCAGTGSGKTLAFYLPALLKLAPLIDASTWTKCLAIYPRNELLKDQLREALDNGRRVNEALVADGRRAMSFGALYADVKEDAGAVARERGWRSISYAGGVGRECPFVRCPDCGSRMVWPDSDRALSRETLTCPGRCKVTFGGDMIRLTRRTLRASPPDVLFTSTEMLNQRMASAEFGSLFGIGVSAAERPVLVLLDEIHTYEGAAGAQVAMLLRRWRHMSKSRAHFVGLSATLEDAARFFADLVGIAATAVHEVAPRPEELLSEGADYQLALRSNPSDNTSVLSTTIQVLMLMRRILDRPESTSILAGHRVFSFADDHDVINRLFSNLRHAEGRTRDGRNRPDSGGTVLAGLRSERQPDHRSRFASGQSWDLVQYLGHTLELRPNEASSLQIYRTSSKDPGVEARADVVVASSSLEVGFDDPLVGAVVQHRAPKSAASFLQRKGRAGRRRELRPDGSSVSMRPWTIVVLSDFGRDRNAYHEYERIFSPELEPRHLPTGNRTLLRMQATYVLFDWLGVELRRAGEAPEPWFDLARPAAEVNGKRREAKYIQLLRGLLEDSNQQRVFATFVERALGQSQDEVQALLWEQPRSVLLEAVPTLLRRLESGWRRYCEGTAFEPMARYGPPLPEFVQKTLFGELLVPEVGVYLPNEFERPTEEMALTSCLRELAPGRVSRRFTIDGDQSHWVDPGTGPVLSLETFCGVDAREVLGRFVYRAGDEVRQVDAYRPYAVRVALVPGGVEPTSNGRAVWHSQLVPSSSGGHPMDLPGGSSFGALVEPLRFHTHHLGAPIELRRFTVASTVALLRTGGRREPERRVALVDEHGAPAALGHAMEVDAVEVRFRYPPGLVTKVTESRSLLQTLRPLRFRDLVRIEPRLDPDLNVFSRDFLTDCFTAALVIVANGAGISLESAAGRIGPADLLRCAGGFALWSAPSSNDHGSETSEGEDDHDDAGAALPPTPGGREPRRVRDLRAALSLPVLPILVELAASLWEQPGPRWENWLRGRFKSTLGASLHGAMLDACPAIDERSVLVDLEFYVESTAEPACDQLWLTESSAGGAGAIEAFYVEYARDPRRFCRLWESQLAASDLERVAASLNALVSIGADPASEIARAFSAVRDAHSHEKAVEATLSLRTCIARAGIIADSSVMTAVHARLLRPGSTAGLDSYLAELIRTWDSIESELGVAVDVRLFALLSAGDDRLEARLELRQPGLNADELSAWRYSNLVGILWRPPGSLRGSGLQAFNNYAAMPECDRLLLRDFLESGTRKIDVASTGWFEAMEEALVAQGTAQLYAPIGQRTLLASALLRVATEAVDTGGLRIHARLIEFSQSAIAVEAIVELPEAFQ